MSVASRAITNLREGVHELRYFLSLEMLKDNWSSRRTDAIMTVTAVVLISAITFSAFSALWSAAMIHYSGFPTETPYFDSIAFLVAFFLSVVLLIVAVPVLKLKTASWFVSIGIAAILFGSYAAWVTY